MTAQIDIPRATYRIQFNPDFGFEAAREIVPYLSSLGISHLYASPIFAARKGSTHGYDIVDPNKLNPELGTRDDFEALIRNLRKHGLYHLQDIVPNHMAYDSDNLMLMDVLENGKRSLCWRYFDFLGEDTSEDTAYGSPFRLLAPFLSKPYRRCLALGEIEVIHDHEGLAVRYADLRLPLRPESYPTVLGHGLSAFERACTDRYALDRFVSVLNRFDRLASTSRGRLFFSTAHAKQELRQLCSESREVREYTARAVRAFNQSGRNMYEPNLLHELLARQHFRLAFWKKAGTETNYRRFFTISRLISLRTEYPRVFVHTHRLILDLIGKGLIAGLRIDHIDGLLDPTGYLRRLKQRARGIYVVVEKILGLDEDLPSNWPVEGTTGYDFLNHANGLFVDSRMAVKSEQVYRRFTGLTPTFQDIVIACKRKVLEAYMASDLRYLAGLAGKLTDVGESKTPGATAALENALAEVIACFPVYRTYIEPGGFSRWDSKQIADAFSLAKRRRPDLRPVLEALFKKAAQGTPADQDENTMLWFIRRFQQFTGPAMAKGLEDSALYIYNCLTSLNDVGGDPSRFGITRSEFHAFIDRRQARWPHTMNATSTHDTKRGEDVRARINVLSELPDEWEARINRWRSINKVARERHGTSAIDSNTECFLYQTLVGAFPFDETEHDDFTQRIGAYMIKAAREAKTHTVWDEPDAQYEKALVGFVDEILKPSEDNRFLDYFIPFHKRIAYYGMLNSLSQTLIKIAAPGVPDFYQGGELWNLSLVDPDNRRPVDFEKRMAYLSDIEEKCKTGIFNLIEDLLMSMEDGRVKLFLIYRALQARKERIDLFSKGKYIPIDTKGSLSRHVIAFGRSLGSEAAICIAPRLLTGIVKPNELPLGKGIWKDTEIVVPDGFPSRWKDAITDKQLMSERTVRLADVLQHFPVALLVSQKEIS